MKSYQYIIIICIILLLIIYMRLNTLRIRYNDAMYIKTFQVDHMKNLHNNNIMNKIIMPNKHRVLIITYDNRTDIPFIKVHNDNIQKYTNRWNYKYKFVTKCDYNVYWCKMYLILNELETNKYDYVMWMDSDTIINNYDLQLHKILNQYDSDIFVGYDNNNFTYIINAGVFIIKNTPIGKQYMRDCINNFNVSCLNDDLSLKGIWAGTCYEQGIMNLLIINKYKKHTTILPRNIIYNKNICRHDVFIMHLYASSPEKRLKCFTDKDFIENLNYSDVLT